MRRSHMSEQESRYSNGEGSFDELAKGLASGTVSRGKALRLMGAALIGGTLASIPGVALAAKPQGEKGCHQPGHTRLKGGKCGFATCTQGSTVDTACGTSVVTPTNFCGCRTEHTGQTFCSEPGLGCIVRCTTTSECPAGGRCTDGGYCAAPCGTDPAVIFCP
jgi:hypothetical protein